MRLVADEGIPLLDEDFALWADVKRLPGRDITRADLLHADAILVRSITPVNAELLAGTKVRFVGSTTSGVDHIDQAFLRGSGIAFAHAPACNADAVADYVCSALAALGVDLGQPAGLRVGVVGLGQVGSRVAQRLNRLGYKIKAYDPFLNSSQGPFLTSWREVLRSDVLSLHVPLTHSGDYPTHHMLNAVQLAALPQQLILINTARGAVIDNNALSEILPQRPTWQTVLDVWEGEPTPNQTLLHQVDVATAHIAGHSVEAKNRGSRMVYRSFLKCFYGEELAAQHASTETVAVGPAPSLKLAAGSRLNDIVLDAYDVRDDAQQLTALAKRNENISEEFDRLRKHYRARHEFAAWRLDGGKNLSSKLIRQLNYLNFNT